MRMPRLVPILFIVFMLALTASWGDDSTFSRAYARGVNIRSMVSLMNVAIALEAYRSEHGTYPLANSMHQLRFLLRAHLGDELGLDRWREPLVVTVTPDSYVLLSKGDDKQGGHEHGGAVETAGHSITLKNGVFVQYHLSVESTAREYEKEIKGSQAPSD